MDASKTLAAKERTLEIGDNQKLYLEKFANNKQLIYYVYITIYIYKYTYHSKKYKLTVHIHKQKTVSRYYNPYWGGFLYQPS